MRALKVFFGVFENLYNSVFKKSSKKDNFFPVSVDYCWDKRMHGIDFSGHQTSLEKIIKPKIAEIKENCECIDSEFPWVIYVKKNKHELPDFLLDFGLRKINKNNLPDGSFKSETNKKYLEKMNDVAGKYRPR